MWPAKSSRSYWHERRPRLCTAFNASVIFALVGLNFAENCYDNAFMESCFGTIKTELEMECYENELIAQTEIGGYLRYYNTRRRHSALDYQKPEEFEATGATTRRRR